MEIELFLVFSYSHNPHTDRKYNLHECEHTTWMENTRKNLINILKIIPSMQNRKTTMGCNITHQWIFKSPMQLFMGF